MSGKCMGCPVDPVQGTNTVAIQRLAGIDSAKTDDNYGTMGFPRFRLAGATKKL
jgi:hypothetical protein